MPIPNQRHLFSIPESHAYLNTAYMSPLMHSVVSAMESGLQEKVSPWNYKAEQFFTDVDIARGLAAQVFGTAPQNIAIVPSASYGIQTAANNLPLRAGQNILVLENQFPSHIYPWQAKAAEVGAHVRILPIPKDDDWTQVVLSAMDAKTAVVAVPHTHWSTGATLDLLAIREALDAVGGALVLDLTQSLGAQVFDASVVRPDFAVAATYKWLLGPYSCGFLYVDPKWHGGRPLEENWINRAGSEDFGGLTRYQSDYQAGAVRFDMGEKSNPAQMRGASAALRQILDWGVESIAETLLLKTKQLESELEPLGLRAAKIRAPHYLGLRVDGVKQTSLPEGLLQTLADQHIYVSARGPALRVTPHLYTSDKDIDRLIEALKRAL
jgi:selenocysteine lyase/cysteine desulfurase